MDYNKPSWVLDVLSDPHLKKALFLRRLSADASAGFLSDDTLRFLELIAELDRSLGVSHPHESIKAAYAAVAVELTAAPLRKAVGPCADDSDFLDAVDRIWTRRVAGLERSDAKGLVGDRLVEWRSVVEDATVSDAARERLQRRDTKGEAEKAVREYVRVAMKGVAGTRLMELVTRVVSGKVNSGADERRPSGMPAERIISAEAVTVLPDQPCLADGVQKILPVQKLGKLDGSRLAGETETEDEDIPGQHLLPIQDVNEVMKALKPMCTDLPKLVKIPLPEPVVRDAEIQNQMVETPANLSDSGCDQRESDICIPEPSIEKEAQTAAAEGADIEHQQGGKHAEMPRFSFLERKPNAHTMEWDEDLNAAPSEKPADSRKRFYLVTMDNEEASPGKLQKISECARRRKTKKWTPQEEDALREAVQKHGKGRWKFILCCYSGTFEGRTEVDLKDKWRNMSRSMLALLNPLLGPFMQISFLEE